MNRRMSSRRRERILVTHNRTCGLCKQEIKPPLGFEVDHVIPLAISQDDSDGNLQPVCIKCHAVKTTKDRMDIAKVERMRMKHEGSWRSRHPMNWRAAR